LEEEEKEALLVPSTVACLKANTKETTAVLRLTLFSAYVVCPETHYIKPRAQIPTQDAEGSFELLIPHDKEDLTLDYLFKIR
jgi:hypothetical protein